jgi:NAD(P)-dependent dehydrogenase (short-subunit alcohol dehydrogenase family)
MSDEEIVLVTGAGSGIGRAVVEALAQAGHCVYASMRSIADRNRERAAALQKFAAEHAVDIRIVEIDVLSEESCRAAIDQVLAEHRRLDVVVNNAGMLMTGMTEAFTPDQVAEIFNTNAISWLRVNRAALPVMRRQGRGLLVYISSTTARIFEAFLGPYAASKAAGDALAEVMSFEVSRFGIESVIVMPGAFTTGTEHFHHANAPKSVAVTAQYGDLPEIADSLASRLDEIDTQNGGALHVSDVGSAVREVLALPHGQRPKRVVIDSQRKGIEALNALHDEKQTAFFENLGIRSLMSVPEGKR